MVKLDEYKEKYKDERFYNDIFVTEEYKCVRSDNRDTETIIDVGALAGEFGFYVYDQARTIYAIEPVESYYQELTQNIKEFGFEKVKPFNLALSKNGGPRTVTIDPTRGGNRLTDGEGQPVESRTLAQFIKDNGIEHVDIIKIDIEDGEIEVFNAPDFKDVADRIDKIVGEHLGNVHDILELHGFKPTSHGINTVYAKTA